MVAGWDQNIVVAFGVRDDPFGAVGLGTLEVLVTGDPFLVHEGHAGTGRLLLATAKLLCVFVFFLVFVFVFGPMRVRENRSGVVEADVRT